jgi:hypothetical protein
MQRGVPLLLLLLPLLLHAVSLRCVHAFVVHRGWDDASPTAWHGATTHSGGAARSDDGVEFDVLLRSPSLGLRLSPQLAVQGFERGDGGAVLEAEASGVIRLHDTLVSVNGVTIAGSSMARASTLIHTALQPRVLRFRRSRRWQHSVHGGDFNVTVDGKQGLGVRLDAELFVLAVAPTSPLFGSVFTGHRIVAVDGVSLLQPSGGCLLHGEDVLRRSFQPAAREEVVCRSVDHARYCSLEAVAAAASAVTLTVRPPSDGAAGVSPSGGVGVGATVAGAATVPAALDVHHAVDSAAVLSRSPAASTAQSTSCTRRGCAFAAPAGVLDVGLSAVAFGPHGMRADAHRDGVALSLPFVSAAFSGAFHCTPRPLLAAVPPDGCAAASDAASRHVRGGVMVALRGGCSFARKTWLAQEAGAVALVVVDNDDSPLQRMPAGGESTDDHVVIASGVCPSVCVSLLVHVSGACRCGCAWCVTALSRRVQCWSAGRSARSSSPSFARRRTAACGRASTSGTRKCAVARRRGLRRLRGLRQQLLPTLNPHRRVTPAALAATATTAHALLQRALEAPLRCWLHVGCTYNPRWTLPAAAASPATVRTTHTAPCTAAAMPRGVLRTRVTAAAATRAIAATPVLVRALECASAAGATQWRDHRRRARVLHRQSVRRIAPQRRGRVRLSRWNFCKIEVEQVWRPWLARCSSRRSPSVSCGCRSRRARSASRSWSCRSAPSAYSSSPALSRVREDAFCAALMFFVGAVPQSTEAPTRRLRALAGCCTTPLR